MIAREQAIVFDNFTSKSGAADMIPGDTDVWVWEAGSYFIHVNLHHTEPCQFSIFKNTLPAVSAIFSSPTGATQNSHTLINDVLPEDISEPTALSPSGFGCRFTFVNHTSFVDVVDINGVAGGGSAGPDATATMTIILLKRMLLL